MTSPKSVAVTVVGDDRPGIVAGVTKALYESGCNLEDVSSTILQGHFAMMLIVSSPEADAGELEGRLQDVAAELGLVVTARPVGETGTHPDPATHMVSVYGADHPGIVYRVAVVLAERGINITDLTSRLIGDEESPVYALMLEVAAPSGTDVGEALDGLAAELSVELSVHPLEADLL
jgi:glycine cleavage system transcriptional repressor